MNTKNIDFIDRDRDGLSNCTEMILGTDPGKEDTDGDGMPDGWEFLNGLKPLAKDGEGDVDKDGLSNLEEFKHGTNPRDPDSDDDLFVDGWDPLPLLNNWSIIIPSIILTIAMISGVRRMELKKSDKE